MIVGVPGRAFRMPENHENYSKDLERPNFNSLVWLHPTTASFGDKHNYTPKHVWDQNRDTKNIGKDCVIYRDQMGIKDNKSNRPSTAVRRHVKKISDEFTITQTKYENSTRPNGILIHIEPSANNKDYISHPGALNSVLSPKSHSGRHSQRKISPCTKCIPHEDQVAPMVSSPPVITNNGRSRYVSRNGPLHSIDSSPNPSPRRGQNENFKRGSMSCIPPFSASGTSLIARQGFNVEADGFVNHSRRRKSQSAHAGTSGGVLKVPFEQVKKAKQFAENAVREGKVFSIHGGFPAIRDALTKRGWVEKVLTSIPYINPHPQNCVCTNVGWHVPLPSHQIPLNHHLHPSNSSDTASSTSSSAANSQPSITANSSFINSTDNSVISNTLQSDVTDECQRNSNDLDDCKDKNSSSDSLDDRSNSIIIVEDGSRISTHDVDSMKSEGESICKNTSFSTNNFAPVVINEDSYIETKMSTQVVNLENESYGGINIDHDSAEYIRKMTKTINTAFLGPSEIREGLTKSINRKNLSIFQYSVPPYEKKRKSTFTKPESDTKTSKTDEVEETNKHELSEQNSNEDENEDGKENVEEKIKEEEENKQPYNPYPKLDVILTDLDKPVVARVLRNIEPNFIWCWSRDSVSFKHLSKEQLVNRFPNTPFTTKFGLCETLQQLHWFSEAASVDSFVPRAYCIGLEDERTAFIHDYRTTACLNMLRWIVERNDNQALQTVAHPLGEVPYRRIRQALQHVEMFIQSCCHDDLDAPPLSPLREGEWDALLTAHHRIIHQGRRIKAPQHHIESLVEDCRSALERVEPYWPQLPMDGVRNVWIVKPGAQSRGRGIFLLNRLEEILALVQSPLIYQTKYVVQKYMERPLLIHNTKFDIRQWFMVTDWNPLTLWMYKECYLRFCSQQYDLTNNDEAIHLSNNAIQCKYHNGIRDGELPEENMWDCHQFKEYLRNRGHGDVFSEIIFPGMKEALIATMLASQVQMDSFKHGYEFFGADFMLTEDFRPWLIEINSSPCMAPTTSVTKRMCYEGLQDTIKVVVDYRQDKTADTGNFELIYQDKEKTVSNLPYVGITLQVVGRQIWKGPPKQDKRKPKNKIKSLPKVLKSIPLITLQLEDTGDIKPAKLCPILDCQKYSEIGPTLMAVVSPPSLSKSSGSSKSFSVNQSEDMSHDF